MTKQTALSQLQSRFGLKQVAVEVENFSDMPALIAGYLKEGGTQAELSKEFGAYAGKVYAALAKDGSFYLKPLMSAARDSFESSVVGSKGERDMERFRARLVSMCWVFKNGDAVGTPKQLGDEMRSDLVDALFKLSQEMNGMKPDAAEEAGKD